MIVNKCFDSNESYNKILFETENFKVIPSLGSMVEGWLLVIPKKHFISYGEITDLVMLKEVNMLIHHISAIIKFEYGDHIIFEHGPVGLKSSIGCGVDYAHIHIVPLNLMIEQINELSDKHFIWERVEGIDSSSSYTFFDKPYLYFHDCKGRSYMATSSEIPSQFFRRIIANLVGKPEMFNWNNHYFLDNIRSTYTRLEKYNKKVNWSKLGTYA